MFNIFFNPRKRHKTHKQHKQHKQQKKTHKSKVMKIPLTNKGLHYKLIPENMGGAEQKYANAAGIIPYYIDRNNRLYFLLGLNHYNNALTTWQYFGGGNESCDSSTRDNAYREAKEECVSKDVNSSNVSYGLPLKKVIWPSLYKGKFICIPKLNTRNKKWNNMYFIYINKNIWNNGKNNLIINNNEVYKLEWFRYDKLPKNVRSQEASVIRYFASGNL